MKWPTIPENLSELTAAQLRELSRSIRDALATNAPDLGTAADVEEFDTYVAKRDEIKSLAAAKDKGDKAAKDTSDDEVEEVVEPLKDAVTPPPADEPPPPASPDPSDQTGTVGTVADPTPNPNASAVHTALGVATTTETVGKGVRAQQLIATDAAAGKNPGDAFESWTELSESLMARASNISSGSDVKHTVAQIKATFGEGRVLSENPMFNLDLFSNDEITAAFCAPLQPLYDLNCANTSRRPVANSLPAFQFAARGGFSVYPSPSLTSITGGYGQWTVANENNPAATKAACQTITCATPVEYRIYGVYRCLTVRNLLQMTFPELVEAYLNRLAAAQARLAETLLLEAMGNASTQIDAVTLGYNANTTILSTILNYLGLYQEVERWDNGPMDVWLPRWVLYAMKADLVRRRRTDGGVNLVPSDDQIMASFRDAGVTPHFFMDRPSWATPIPNLATSGILNLFPRNLEMIIAPRGKFALMDRGELNIGVGGNIMRDNTSLNRNEFTFFFESFEGLIDTNTCPAHLIQINNLCYSGVQIDDVILGCEGIDEPGIGS